MQPRVTQAGPLAASSATKIALSQSPHAAGYLALNGAAGTATANNICTSQSGTAATPLTINGTLKQTQYVAPTSGVTGATIAMLAGSGSPIYITSAGNDSSITFAIVGTAAGPSSPPVVLTETVTGTNASVVASANAYQSIISVTPSGNTASTVTVGSMGFATLDVARQVLFTSGGNDSGITITISGTDWAGDVISETVTGGNTTATTVLNYLTITSVKVSGATASTITVGTNGVAASPWINFDTWAMGTINGQAVVSGTVNYTIQTSNDDPNSYGNPIAASSMAWDSNAAGVTGATASTSFGFAASPLWMRILLNSGSGSVRLTAIQNLSAVI